MRVVLDTNVLISGLINPEGAPAQVVSLLLNGRITALFDDRMLREYREVLHRQKFGFTATVVAPLLEYIRSEGEYVAAEPISEKRFPDEDDRMFYEVAVTGNARCVITGNKDHYPREAIIRSPKEFVALYLSENEQPTTETT